MIEIDYDQEDEVEYTVTITFKVHGHDPSWAARLARQIVHAHPDILVYRLAWTDEDGEVHSQRFKDSDL